jgi:hypothetical protein
MTIFTRELILLLSNGCPRARSGIILSPCGGATMATCGKFAAMYRLVSLCWNWGVWGGITYFGHRYQMIGISLSFGSLKNVPAYYACKLQADATRLPLPDGSVDAIVSSFFWGAYPPRSEEPDAQRI